jgi:ubiquinone/menaquinone biosynthesis C-methylase UbiE
MSVFKDRFYALQDPELGLGNLDARHEALLSCLEDATGKDVLEIACGSGDFAKKVMNRFNLTKIYGVDISEQALKLASEKGVVGWRLNLDKDNLPYQDNFFDTVICGEVIEHLVDPDHLLEEIYRVLKPDGHLLITTPNLASWYNRLLLLFGYQPFFTSISIRHTYPKPLPIHACGHLCSYTLGALKFLLEKYHFKAVKVIGLKINESMGYGIKYRWLTKLANTLFRTPSLSSGICILARKVSA